MKCRAAATLYTHRRKSAGCTHLLLCRPQLPQHRGQQLQAVGCLQRGAVRRKRKRAAGEGSQAGRGSKGQQCVLAQQVARPGETIEAGRQADAGVSTAAETHAEMQMLCSSGVANTTQPTHPHPAACTHRSVWYSAHIRKEAASSGGAGWPHTALQSSAAAARPSASFCPSAAA